MGRDFVGRREPADESRRAEATGMNVVVPMAGLGSRFAKAGFTTPKPLIPVLGRPMYSWAVDSLPFDSASGLIFVLLRSQPEYPALKKDIEQRYAALRPVVLDVPELTAG